MRVFLPERGLMIRERFTGSYRVGAYFLAKSTSDIGVFTVAPILFATAVYWCVGLRPEAGAFLIYLLLFTVQVSSGSVFEGRGWDTAKEKVAVAAGWGDGRGAPSSPLCCPSPGR